MVAFFKKKDRSACLARERMDLLLVSERIECSPETIQMMKRDFIHTVKKYAKIDEEKTVLKVQSDPAVLHFEAPVIKK